MDCEWGMEMLEFVEETAWCDYIDFDYEFDAVKFYDFDRFETESEAEEAQRWFDCAGNYPPSPLVMKVNWKPNVLDEEGSDTCSSISSDVEIVTNDLELKDDDVDDGSAITKHSVKPVLLRNLSFMNPTASQLAKKNYFPQVQWEQLLRRSERWCQERRKKTSRRSSVNGAQATKRQKLECGFWHKAGMDSKAATSRPRITIPRQPLLATAYRAERRRFKTKLEPAENTRQDDFAFRARPLNRKILKAPSLPLLKKSTPQMPDFQEFHLRTLERAMQHASFNATSMSQTSSSSESEVAECRRANSDPALKEKLKALDKLKIEKDCNLKEPPIESFSKLSLVSESAKQEAKVAAHSKASKENEPTPLIGAAEVLAVKWQGGRSYQCGGGQMVHSIGLQINVNRSLDMR